MKKLFIFYVVVCSNFFISAQIGGGTMVGPGEAANATPYGTQVFVRDASEDPIEGNRYFEETNKLAVVYINKKRARRCLMRYNAYYDQIEVTENNKVFNLIKRDDMKVVIEDEGYVYKIFDFEEASRFFILLQEGDISLLKRVEKKVKVGKDATTGYETNTPSRYIEKHRYFLKDKSGDLVNVKLKKKEILKVLTAQKDEVEKYASSKRLSFRKEKDLVKIIKHYNTL